LLGWVPGKVPFGPASFSRPETGAPAPERIWFHAASAGELESLWTVIEECSARDTELIVTVFSRSAEHSLAKLRLELEARGVKRLTTGYSPWEGFWGQALNRLAPTRFVTARYEAWPELWASLANRGIPLVVVGALDRSSLRWARRLSRGLVSRIPEIHFLCSDPKNASILRETWPGVRISLAEDPRWDRVFARAQNGSPRARELLLSFASFSRPWGVFGSVWPSDLEFWGSQLRALPGTLWLVPHRVEEGELVRLEKQLAALGLRWVRSSPPERRVSEDFSGAAPGETPRVVLVNEVGFLSELYAGADWAFVGGGFGDGVHSTIEPAIHGLPLAAGPARADRFPEISSLQESGQLRILRSSVDLARWTSELSVSCSPEAITARRREVEARRGGTQSVLESLLERAVAQPRVE
jgi:3-deoxy-D-manno-octulosonic-acid transferase